MLQGKYLKYTEDITLEIFTKIIERLNKTGWKHLVGDSIDNQFNRFTNEGYLVYCTAENNYSFYKDSVLKSTDVELKVSDILGEESRFEADKWYKWYQTNHENFHIGKFKELTDSSDSFYMEPWIANTINYTESGCFILKFAEQIQELTLEEIQQYLPDNHPDKVVKSIEKWSVGSYVVFCENNTAKDVLLNKPYEIIKKSLNSTDINIIDEAGNLSITDYTSPLYIIKWFATLSEAEAFSKSLLEPEESKPLTINDLVEGEIYYCLNNTICKWGKKDSIYSINSNKEFWSEPGSYSGEYNFRPATPEEKKWLLTCIKQDKFIPQDQLNMYDSEGNLIEDKPKTNLFEFNKWYKYKGESNYLVFIHKDGRYGFDCEGNWFDSKYQEGSIEHFKPSEWEAVKDSEVKERLLSYAKEKYPVGTKFKCMAYDKEFTVTDPNYMDNANGFKPNDDSTIWIRVKEQCSGKIFDGKGKWAEVISKPESKESKEFDRNWYVEVNSQEEADKVFDWLEAQGEKIGKEYYREFREGTDKYISYWKREGIWFVNSSYEETYQKQLSDILPEYKQSIKTEEELSHIFDTNKELRCEIQGLINQRDFKSSDFAEPIVIKNKKQKRNKLIIVNN